MSSVSERRRAARIACRLPVRLLRGGHVTYGLTEDVSRTGLRVRVPLRDLGLADEAELPAVARRLDQRMGEACVGEIGWQTLGSLVRKVLRVARVARVAGLPGVIDLGCELRVALDALEIEALGLDLPPLAQGVDPRLFECEGPVDAALAAAVAADEQRGRARRRRAVLMPARERCCAPLLGEARALDEQSVLLALAAPRRLGLTSDRQDAAGLMLAFDDRFGSDLGLLLLEGEEPLWSGCSRVHGLELRRAENRLLLSMSLGEPLRPEEAARLGL